MRFLSDHKKRYLLLIPLALLLFNALFFQFSNKKIQEAILDEKLVAIIEKTDMLAASVEANPERPWYEHEQNIRDAVEYMDRLYQVYGGAYKSIGGELVQFTDRYYETTIFEPLEYPEFIAAINADDSGKIVIGYTPENQTYRELHLYFRWMPLYSASNERYLVVGGVSQYSIVTQIPVWVSTGQWISMAITFVMQIWIVVMLAQLGHIWEQRKGDKWRDGGDNIAAH